MRAYTRASVCVRVVAGGFPLRARDLTRGKDVAHCLLSAMLYIQSRKPILLEFYVCAVARILIYNTF